MRAVTIQQAPTLDRIFEQHEVLPQQFDGFDRSLRHARIQRRVELIDQSRWLPILAQQLAAGRTKADSGQAFVLFSVHGGFWWSVQT